MGGRRLWPSAAAIALASAIGLIAFGWPLLAAPDSDIVGGGHSADAPWLFALLLPLLIAVVWAQLADDEDFNTTGWRRAEIPSANGHGTARAIGRLYAMLANGGELDGVRILSAEGVKRMTTEQHNKTEVLRGRAYHQASGVLLNTPPYVDMGPNPRAFGHHGSGGAIGLADPDAKIGFGYGMNRMHADPTNGPRAGGLIKATFASV